MAARLSQLTSTRSSWTQYDQFEKGTLAYNNMSGIGQGGTGTLSVDGKVVATQEMDRSIPLILQWDKNLDVGADSGTRVDDAEYETAVAFIGTLKTGTMRIDHPIMTDEDKTRLQKTMVTTGFPCNFTSSHCGGMPVKAEDLSTSNEPNLI